MTKSTSHRLLLAGALVVGMIGFLLFRPDTLFTEVPIDQSLEEGFTTSATVSGAVASTPSTSGTAPPSTAGEIVEPVVVTSGMFTGIEHDVIGTVNVYEQEGRFVLRFEDDTDIQNGPDL